MLLVTHLLTHKFLSACSLNMHVHSESVFCRNTTMLTSFQLWACSVDLLTVFLVCNRQKGGGGGGWETGATTHKQKEIIKTMSAVSEGITQLLGVSRSLPPLERECCVHTSDFHPSWLWHHRSIPTVTRCHPGRTAAPNSLRLWMKSI